jgi:hypothetical protein
MLKWPGGPRKTFLEVVYKYNTSSYITKSVYLDVVTVYDNEFFMLEKLFFYNGIVDEYIVDSTWI